MQQSTGAPAEKPKGLGRLLRATAISVNGLRLAWREAAFRHELLWAVVLVPGAFWIGGDWVEITLLAGSIWLVLVVEVLNSAIEAAVDRVGPEWHPLSKAAKDLASAAVLLSLVPCVLVWGAVLWQRFGPGIS